MRLGFLLHLYIDWRFALLESLHSLVDGRIRLVEHLDESGISKHVAGYDSLYLVKKKPTRLPYIVPACWHAILNGKAYEILEQCIVAGSTFSRRSMLFDSPTISR